MSAVEETIEATLDSNGQVRLAHPSRLPPGPVRVTIRPSATPAARRGLAEILRAIAADQRARGFPGRSADEVETEPDDDAERDREFDAARGGTAAGGP